MVIDYNVASVIETRARGIFGQVRRSRLGDGAVRSEESALRGVLVRLAFRVCARD